MNDGDEAGHCPWSGNYWNSLFINGVGFGLPFIEFSGCFNPWLACRVGEAANPGPDTHPFRVAGLNVQSLNAAVSEQRLDLSADHVMALSETCATQVALDKAAKYASTRGKHSFSSGPVTCRQYASGAVSELRGKSAGVWVAAACHTRDIQLPWPEEIAMLSRACDSIVYTPSGPIYIACIYGLHQGLTDALAVTDSILMRSPKGAALANTGPHHWRFQRPVAATDDVEPNAGAGLG